MKKVFTDEEKGDILKIVKVWKRDQLNQDVFRSIQISSGVPARLVELMFWHMDTLDALRPMDHLVFKGGTCVQVHLAPDLQRASVDLDFNSAVGHPDAVERKFGELNSVLEKKGRAAVVGGIRFGFLEKGWVDRHTGTITFHRRMPSRFGEVEAVDGIRVQAKSIRVQINYKNSWLPAIKSEKKDIRFFITEHQKPCSEVEFLISSAEDLFADKILATCSSGHFGRERFKDVYDMLVLSSGVDGTDVVRKLDMVAEKSRLNTRSIIETSIETISNLSERSQEAKGFASMACRGGKALVADWESRCISLIGVLKQIKLD